jgi:hypothetical protein
MLLIHSMLRLMHRLPHTQRDGTDAPRLPELIHTKSGIADTTPEGKC